MVVVFWYFCMLFYLYFVPFVFCYVCNLAISILFFCILSCLYFEIFVFCHVVFCFVSLYFVLFVLWNICILSRIRTYRHTDRTYLLNLLARTLKMGKQRWRSKLFQRKPKCIIAGSKSIATVNCLWLGSQSNDWSKHNSGIWWLVLI